MQRRQLLQVSTAAIGAISLAGCTINSGGESGEPETSGNSENSEADSDDSNPEENTDSVDSSDTADSSESSGESDSDSGSSSELVAESVDSVKAVGESNSVEKPENGVETQEGTFSIDSDNEYGYHLEPLIADEPAIIRWSITNERSPEYDFDVFFFTESQSAIYEKVTAEREDRPIRYVPEGTVLGLEQSAERTVRLDPGNYYLVVDATEFGEAGAERVDKTIELTMKLEAWDA